jgi:uncharacterized protein YuzB (UPF0349 family)
MASINLFFPLVGLCVAILTYRSQLQRTCFGYLQKDQSNSDVLVYFIYAYASVCKTSTSACQTTQLVSFERPDGSYCAESMAKPVLLRELSETH